MKHAEGYCVHSVKKRAAYRTRVLFIALAILVIILFVPIIPVAYNVKEPYERVETYYENVPVEVVEYTEWNVTWYTLQGDFKFWAELGTSKFPGIFSYQWNASNSFKGYRDPMGFKANATINVQKREPVWFNISGYTGCELYLNGSPFLFTSTYSSSPYKNASTQTTLSPGKYTLTLIYYKQGATGLATFSTNRDVVEWRRIEYKNVPSQRTVTDYQYATKTTYIGVLSYLLGQYPR